MGQTSSNTGLGRSGGTELRLERDWIPNTIVHWWEIRKASIWSKSACNWVRVGGYSMWCAHCPAPLNFCATCSFSSKFKVAKPVYVYRLCICAIVHELFRWRAVQLRLDNFGKRILSTRQHRHLGKEHIHALSLCFVEFNGCVLSSLTEQCQKPWQRPAVTRF